MGLAASLDTFSPLRVSTLTGWYDFSDLATLFQDTSRATPVTADAQLIGSMADKSGGARHLARGGIAGTEPVVKFGIRNGLGIGRFDSTKWLLSGSTFAADTQQTIICVANNTAGVTLMSPWSRTDNNNNRFASSWNNGSSALGMFAGTGAGSYSEVWGAVAAGWTVVSCVVNNTGAISQVYGNGKLQSSATGVPGITTSLLLAIGSRQTSSLTSGFNSDIGELLVFSTALASVPRAQVEAYLRNKWGAV